MGLSTLNVAAHTTPIVISRFFAFLLKRRSRKGKPQAELSYDEGLAIIRQFLAFAATNTVEDLQSFTRQKVPTPNWVMSRLRTIPEETLSEAASILKKQLSVDDGLAEVGGEKWWQVRALYWRFARRAHPLYDQMRGIGLQGEWIEMVKDNKARMKLPVEKHRYLLYSECKQLCEDCSDSLHQFTEAHSESVSRPTSCGD